MKKVQKYSYKFQHKYRAFSILQNKIKELEERTTKMWKVIYGLATLKLGQEDLFKDIDKCEEQEDKQEEEEEE